MRTLALTLALVATPALAEFKSGNDIYEMLLENQGSFNHSYAFGYVIGAIDAQTNVTICPPANVTQGQILDVAKEYLRMNPSRRHFSADSVLGNAFSAIWPCRRGNGV